MIYEANIYSDNNFGSKIDIFKSTKVKVEKRSRVIKAPVENGLQSFDNKVIDPIVIRVTGVIDCTDPNSDNALNVIDKMFFNRDFEFYSVSSKDGSYDNLILQDAPRDEDSDRPDWAVFELVFVEAMLIQGGGIKSANGENGAVSNGGFIAARRI